MDKHSSSEQISSELRRRSNDIVISGIIVAVMLVVLALELHESLMRGAIDWPKGLHAAG